MPATHEVLNQVPPLVNHDVAADREDIQLRARRLVETMSQGSLLVRRGNSAVADAFCASRLGGDWGVAFGTLPAGVNTAAILDRARPGQIQD